MSRNGSHFVSDLEAMEDELLRMARMPMTPERTQSMEELQLRIRDREYTINSRSAEVAIACGAGATQPEIHAESMPGGKEFGSELLTLIKAAFFRIIEARTPRRETLCHAMAFGFAHPSYPSARQASKALGCSPEEISFRIKEIQREFSLPSNQFNKSAKATARYRETNGARRKTA